MVENSGGDIKQSLNEFFVSGLKSYVEALLALREYRKLVCDMSRKLLEKRIQAFADSIGQNISKNDIGDYVDPDGIPEGYDAWGAWIAVRVVACSPQIYFGMTFGLDDGRYIPYATIMMSTSYKDELYSRLCEACDTIADEISGVESEHNYEKEVSLSIPIKNPDDFQSKLETLCDYWIKVLKSGQVKKSIKQARS